MKRLCVGCNELKELFITETKSDLPLCIDCLKAIFEDDSLKEDVYGK